MKFQEFEETLTLPNIEGAIIYFLIDKGEVVYVGQSNRGLSRPYQHVTKEFEKVAVLQCKDDELDYLETKYIQKYKPKYNKTILNSYSISLKRAKKMIREQTFFKEFTVNDLKWIIRRLGLETDTFDGVVYVKRDDFEKIVSFIQEYRNVITQSQFWKNRI